jgi:large subunit ribosomal protein L22
MSTAGRQAPEGGWESLKVDELRAELEARGLPKAGRKDELVARLVEDDASGDAGADAAPAEAPSEEAGGPQGPPAEEEAAEGEPVAEAEPQDEEAVEGEPVAEAEPQDEEAVEGEPVAEAEPEDVHVEAEPAEEEPVAEAEGAEEEGAEEAARPPRRGSAETTPTTERRPPAPQPDGALVVSARAKYVRSAPRKARLVMAHIRGKNVEQAQAILRHAPRAVSGDILKLLNSAVANAESSYELGPDELRIQRAFVDEGPTIKRFRPRARGRATRILKRTSHMTIELTTEGNEG